MRFPFRLNPLAVFFTVLCLIVLCSIAAFYLALYGSYEIGVPPLRFNVREVYHSEPWEIITPDFLISLRDESFVSPVYLDERLVGIVVQGGAGYLAEQGSTRRLYLEDFFLTLNSEFYTEIKGDTLFLPVNNTALRSRVLAGARPLIRLPELQGLIYPRTFPPPPQAICVYTGDGGSILPAGYSVNFYNPRLFLFFSLVVLIVLLVIYLMTMDLHPTLRLKRIYSAKPLVGERLAAAFFLALMIALGVWGKLPGFKAAAVNTETMIIYYAVFFALLFLHIRQFSTNSFFVLRMGVGELLRGIMIVPVILMIIFLFATLKFPTGFSISPHTHSAVLQHFIFLYFYAYAAEFFWRGYLQTFLERLWGQGAGLLLSTALFTLPLLVSNHIAYGFPFSAGRTLEIFFFFPLTALPLAYLYQRSRNLPGVALLHALLLFLPGFLLF